MSYATAQDMAARFGAPELDQLADRNGDGMPDAGVVDGALADADAEIDAYLAGRYPLPLAHVPPVLARIACDIARYRLWADKASEEVRNRYADARRLLEQVAAGRVLLGVSTDPATPPSAGTMQLAAVPERSWGLLQ